MRDQRLLGMWQSDRTETLKNWGWTGREKIRSKSLIRRMFGFLIVTWGRSNMTSRIAFKRHKLYFQLPTRDPRIKPTITQIAYEVVAKDSSSVAIRSFCPIAQEDRLKTITFHGPDLYSVDLGGNREFFRRICPPAS